MMDNFRGLNHSCWSSISWSSLYDRGTDSSLSWADDVRLLFIFYRNTNIFLLQEYEKETTEIVQNLFDQVEDLFYAPKGLRKKKSQSIQEKECFLWREIFPQLRSVNLENSRTIIYG